MLLFSSSYTTFGSSPAHHGCIRSQTSFQNFVPTDDFSAFGIDKFFHSGDKIALQFVFVFEVFSFDNALTMFTGLPSGFRRLIPSNVDIFAREKSHNFIQNIFQKLKSFFFWAKNIIKNSPTSFYVKRTS